MKRRTFLQRSSLVSLSPFVPMFLPQTVAAADAKSNGKILIVLQLSGGNDGLNTVVPFDDENYAKHRKVLNISRKDVIQLNDSVGLHPSLKPLSSLLDDGKLAIVQGVGYPNPNRSHFESMDIWHTARMNAEDRTGHGWLGRAIEDTAPGPGPDAVFVGDSELPVALRGRRANSISLNSADEMELFASVAKPVQAKDDGNLTSFIQRTVNSSYSAAKQFAESAPASDSSLYPSTRLGRKLELLARILKLGGGTRVFYASQPGYDTHSDQLGRHQNLLREFSRALTAFLTDIEESKLSDRVVVLAFSEFGRRVNENGSAGTDHGTAGPVFVAGAPVKAGLHGTHPSLAELDTGDLKMTTDFRRIYAELLDGWLGADSATILNGRFKPVGIT